MLSINAAEDVLARLKHDTADAHARVDSLVGPMLQDRACYSCLLSSLRGIHQAIERQLAPHAAALARDGYDVAARSKLAWLDADLAALAGEGIECRAIGVSLSLGDATEAFGAVYVIEGATLGGRVIMRQVMPALALSLTAGCRYFAGYGADTGARWRATRDAIAAHVAHVGSPDAVPRMVGAAHATFGFFEAVLSAQRPA